MPWWSAALISLSSVILGWGLRYLYDLKIQPTIDKSRKEAEKEQAEEDEKRKQKKEAIKRSWGNDRQILLDLKKPLEELTSINRFTDSYPPDSCVRLLRSIKAKAEQIERPEFQPLRKKLYSFSEKKDQIHSSTPSHELLYIINGKYDLVGPQDLLNAIDAELKIIPK